MRYWFHNLLIIAGLVVTPVAAGYSLISPPPFTIQRTNWVKLQAGYDQAELKPDSVSFHLQFINPLDVQKVVFTTYEPFEHLVDCKDLPDVTVFIKAVVFNQQKTDTIGTEYDYNGIPLLLDRDPDYKSITHQCFGVPSRKQAYDFLAGLPGETFDGNNNQVHFASAWDADSLYIRIRVRDQHLNWVVPRYWIMGNKGDVLTMLWKSDGIELCFDMLHNRSEWKALDDFEIIATVNGLMEGNQWDRKQKVFRHWEKTVRVQSQYQGTLNDNNDLDTSYSLRFAIPWQTLDFQPQSGDTIGFDFHLFDLDTEKGKVFRTIWSKAELSNNDNTSEWGNLVLVGKPDRIPGKTIILIITLIMAGIVVLYHIKKGKIPAPSIPPNQIVESIKSFIQQEYTDPHLNRSKIAGQVQLNEKYVSSLFKKETGTNLTDYINKIRINKALELLHDQNKHISEIAFEVGYNTLQNFNKAFRKITGKSPREARNT
jgi:AraC-like DNA-binding protein